MKKTVFTLVCMFCILTALILPAYAQIPIEKTALYGDKAFIEEMKKEIGDDIVQNALYVSESGNDNGSGTAEMPFKTVQKALDNVTAGQTVYIRKGTYTGINYFKNSGSEGKYITLRNYPGEKPLLTSSKQGAVLNLNGCGYIRIEGLEIGCFSAPIAQGILLDADEDHIIIKNNDIHDLVTTRPGENEEGEANAVLCCGEGKTKEGSINNICISQNKIHDNTTGWCESVSVTGNTEYVNIINNTVYNNTNIGIDFYGNAGYCTVAELDQPRYCIASGNEIYGCVCDYAECAGLYVDGARDIILDGNVSHSNMYGIEIGSEERRDDYPVKNIIVRNNVVYENPCGGIRVGGYDRDKTGYVKDTRVYNNTLVNNGQGDGGWNGELCFVKCDRVDVKNNIVYKDNSEYPMIGGDLPMEYVKNVTFDSNIYYSPAGAEDIYFELGTESINGIDTFNTFTGGKDLFGKPYLNDNYSLNKNSFGIDTGNSAVNEYAGKYDIAGNSRIHGIIDAGAYEYAVKGDVDRNGRADIDDAKIMLKAISGIITDMTGYDAECIDFNNDGVKNIIDVAQMLRSIV